MMRIIFCLEQQRARREQKREPALGWRESRMRLVDRWFVTDELSQMNQVTVLPDRKIIGQI